MNPTFVERYYQAKTWHERALIMRVYHDLMVSQYKAKQLSWTIRMTAKILDRSSGYVSEDLRLADLVKRYPDILQAASREAALKLMRDYL